MPKVRPAKRRSRVNTGAGLTDAQIKARNETAHAAFLAARRASQRGFDQSKTKIRTSEGKDGKANTSITGSKGADKRNSAAARASARASGKVTEKPTTKKKPFKAGTISRQGGAGNVDPYGTQARGAAATFRAQGSRKKSLDEIQGFLQGMNQIIKREEGFKTRVTGTDLGTKMRHTTDETGKRKVKEVKTGDKFNLQTRIGDAAEKSVCPLIKTELNGAFNNLLDEYQSKYKSIFDEQVANRGNPKPKITNTGRSGRGSLGGDTQKKPKALGESKEDQAVMQS